MTTDKVEPNDEEFESLVTESKTTSTIPTRSSYRKIQPYSKLKKCLILLSIVLVLVTLVLLYQGILLEKNITNTDARDQFLFSCPKNIEKSQNDKDEDLVEWYDTKRENEKDKYDINEDEENITQIVSVYPTNMTQSHIEKILSNNYDGSAWTYNEFKSVMFGFKQKYGRLLKSGDSIFESACGIGLNLLMTADVLHESESIDQLKVYGIEYRASSTADANNILPQLLPVKTENGQLGAPVCRGDATNLFFIPSNSFDLAFTGYIEPIQDPMNFRSELGREVEWDDLCISHKKRTKRGKQDQAAVEEWYAKWVGELIRIAKPGQPIGVEQVSKSTCEDESDWGGVAKTWWVKAVGKYQWDVNIDSIYIADVYKENAKNKKSDRYNVYMEKNKEK